MALSFEIPPDVLTQLTDELERRIHARNRWVTVEGLAQEMGCTTGDIYNLCQRGLPARKIAPDGRRSKMNWFCLAEVHAWMDEESIPA